MIRAVIVSAQGAFYAACYTTGYVGGHVLASIPATGRVCDLLIARQEANRR